MDPADELGIPKEYLQKSYVPGLAELATGLKVNVPTTIYNLIGDDTSGVAGVLFPSGEFIAAQPPRETQRYWDFDETHEYIRTPDGRVVGNSWQVGEVTWDGSVVGSINPESLDGEDGDTKRTQVNRREWNQEFVSAEVPRSQVQRELRRAA